jgi:hypothetical protein
MGRQNNQRPVFVDAMMFGESPLPVPANFPRAIPPVDV